MIGRRGAVLAAVVFCAGTVSAGDLAFGACMPISRSASGLGASRQAQLCASRRVQSSIDTKCTLAGNQNNWFSNGPFKGSAASELDRTGTKEQAFVHVVEKKRTADDLIIDILCDAGDVAGFVFGGLLDNVEKHALPSFAKFSDLKMPPIPFLYKMPSVPLVPAVPVAEVTSEMDEMTDEMTTSQMMAPPSRWEEALVQQIEDLKSSPSACPWRIVAPGCSQVPGEETASQTLQRERLMELREALQRHGTISLVENGSRYLGLQHAQAKQAARPAGSEALPESRTGRVGSWQEMGASVLGEMRSRLPGMPAGRMAWLGMATALGARAKKARK
eukprot:CAMPEP_0177710096 /NCGR_PEP_ID=MMETSP0484_2-20121128/11154_1 /TAXON_ID=354590 /ORGANISM="Rhodomonas lens, Strain RHODO" /LENGTH=331 /DNA_ID=CAMNT_0019221757 /DNA_START=84 /DNA_END=1079 /DNA_ORIENTATION=+